MRTLLIATRNAGKIREYRDLFAHLRFELASLDELGIGLEVEETGNSFEENARLKAVSYANASGEFALADDSGLEVDALHGEPGVLSARYGGPGLDDAARIALLLERMAGVAGWRRTARFRAVLALAGPGSSGVLHLTEAVVEGAICHRSIGNGGFGYDPVFWLPHRAMTMAQLSPAEKNALSHRGRAAMAMAEYLETLSE